MVILGIDPGTRRIGYGVVKKNGSLRFVDAGILKISARGGSAFGGKSKTSDLEALEETKKGLRSVIKKFRPQVMAIEKLYFVKNIKTGLAVAQARGVILLAAQEEKLAVEEYGPNEVKSALTGYGLADKKAVLKMVKLILKTPDLRVIDDASDALALAIVASHGSRKSRSSRTTSG